MNATIELNERELDLILYGLMLAKENHRKTAYETMVTIHSWKNGKAVCDQNLLWGCLGYCSRTPTPRLDLHPSPLLFSKQNILQIS